MENSQDNISEQKFEIGYWITTHRKLIKIIYTIIVGAIALCSMVFFIFYLINWLSHIKSTNDIYKELTNSLVHYEARNKPESIQNNRSQSVIRDEDSIDAVVQLFNPNSIWAVIDVEYEIFIGGISTGKEHITLAPLQEKYVVKSDILFNGSDAPQVSIKYYNIAWKRIQRPEDLAEVEWEFKDVSYSYIQSSDDSLSYKTELSFTLKNKSIYGFRESQVIVLMIDENNIIQGIGSIYLDQISSLETRRLTFRWPRSLASNLTPSIYVNIDKMTESLIIRKLGD